MNTVEVRTPTGRPVAMVLPYPFPFGTFPDASGLDDLRGAARAFGFPYIFVAAHDEVRGWSVGSSQPLFAGSTAVLLQPYTTSADELASAWVNTMASLLAAWMADLQYHWKSGNQPAPGEGDLPSDFLDLLRADEAAP